MNPFDFVNVINNNKDIMDSSNEKGYDPFLTNRQLSYFQDTIFMANEMNKNWHLDGKLQYHFLINIVRKRNRFTKWSKPIVNGDIEVLQECFGYSKREAKSIYHLLSPAQISDLKKRIDKGGKK